MAGSHPGWLEQESGGEAFSQANLLFKPKYDHACLAFPPQSPWSRQRLAAKVSRLRNNQRGAAEDLDTVLSHLVRFCISPSPCLTQTLCSPSPCGYSASPHCHSRYFSFLFLLTWNSNGAVTHWAECFPTRHKTLASIHGAA